MGRRTAKIATGIRNLTTQIFFALSDPHRQEILLRLARGGPQTTLTLLKGIGATRQGATRHLTILEEAGLVKSEKRGREIIREFNPEAVSLAQQWFVDLENAWDSRLDRLRQQYEQE